MKKKQLESCLQMNIQIVIAKTKASLASSVSAIYLIALFTRPFLLYSNVHKKQAFKCLFKIPL